MVRLQVLQHRLPCRQPRFLFDRCPVARHRLAQRSAEPLQDRGLQQEGLDARLLLLEHLFGQVVEDVTVAAAQALKKARNLLGIAAPQREGSQLQAGDPPLGADFQGGHVGGGQGQAHGLVEKGGGLGGRKSQIGAPQLDELPPTAQPGQGQGRVGAAGHSQHQGRRQVVEQETQDAVDGRVLDDVIVVQDQQVAAAGQQGRGVVHQYRQERLHRRRLG